MRTLIHMPTNLPELTKYKKQEESDFGVLIAQQYSKGKIFPYPHQLELKDTYGKDSMLFKEVSDLQLIKCLKIKHEGILIRNTISSSNGAAGIPDYSWTDKQAVYITIRYPKSWCFIDIDTFVLEKERSKKKSMTEERAREISIKVILKK